MLSMVIETGSDSILKISHFLLHNADYLSIFIVYKPHNCKDREVEISYSGHGPLEIIILQF